MWFIYTVEYYLAMRKNEILPFVTTWMELEGIMLGEISQRQISCFHSYVELEKLNKRPWGEGKGRGKNSFKQRGANHKRLLNAGNKQRVDGRGSGEGKMGDGLCGWTCWDVHWVFYVSDGSQESIPETKSTLYALYVS